MSRIYPDPFAERPRPYLSGMGAASIPNQTWSSEPLGEHEQPT
jgi:hypothetical protein